MRSIWFVWSVLASMVGYTIHGSLLWSIVDFFFSGLVVVKWLIYHEITFAITRQTFAFLG